MLEHTFRPLAVAFGTPQDDCFIFNTVKGKVVIRGCNDVLPVILSKSDGLTTIQDILLPLQSDYENKDLDSLINLLAEHKVIVDSRHIYELAHYASENPMSYHYSLTSEDLYSISFVWEQNKISTKYLDLPKAYGTLVSILQKRASNRNLIETPSCSLETFSNLLWSTLGRVDSDLEDPIITGPAFNIPSAGRVYSCELFVVVVGEIEDLVPGLYHYDKINHAVGFLNEVSTDQLQSALDLEEISAGSLLCAIFVTSKINRSTQKYANRGYRYVNLEAGHCAQNAYLSAAELNLSILEYGGFHDSQIASLLGLPTSVYPLISLLVGKGAKRVGQGELRVHS